MKKIRTLCCVLLLCVLCGCYDSRDVKNVAIVMGMGVEKTENGYKTTTQVIVPQGLSKEGGGENTYENYAGEGKHLGGCIENTTLKCGKYMYFSHATSLIIDKSAAEEGIYEILDYFMRDNELRSSLTLAVTESDMEEIMKSESHLMKVPLSAVASLGRRLRETSLGSAPAIFAFVSDMLKKDCATLVPVIGTDKKQITIKGSGVFKKGKMVGKISNDEARGALWLADGIENAIMTIECEKDNIDIKVKEAKSEIRPIYNEGIFFRAEIFCRVSILRDDRGVINSYGMEYVRDRINESVKSEINTSLKKLREMDADVFGFSDIIYRNNPKLWREIQNSGENIFENLKLKINVNTKIEEVGSVVTSADKVQGGEIK